MERDILVALFNNAALLLVLSCIYEAVYYLPSKYRRMNPVISGVLIAIICGVIMSMSFTLQFGIIFDTRTILISATALIFGAIPTVIAATAAVVIRLSIGGVGVWAGLATIMSSAVIGLLWRRLPYPKSAKWQWINILVMSVCVHIVMLACMFLLPYPENLNVIRAVALPVMLVFPTATTLLCMLLLRQQALKNAQQQLMQSEERFKLLFDKAPLGYQSLDSDGNILEVNRQWCDLLGYAREEVIGRWFGDFLPPEDREQFLLRFPVFKKQGHIHSEFRVLDKSGKPVYLAFEGKIGYGSNGEFKQTHCILQDITGQRAAEAALIQSEQKYRSITENMSGVVWQTDMALNTTYISPSVEKLLGISPEEQMKKRLEEKFPEHTIKKITLMLAEELENEKNPDMDKNRSRTIEVDQCRADGTVVWLEMNISIMRDAQGHAIGFLGVSRDITQRKLAESALAESERSKTVFLSNLPGLAYKCKYDRNGTMLIVSEGCRELTGYPPESFVNNRDLSFNSIIEPEFRESLFAEWERTVPNRLPYHCEYAITTAEGKRKWVLENGQGIYGDDGEAMALEGIIFDISDRKEMENHLLHISEHDKLTGFYNRDYLEQLLKKDTGKGDGKKRAVISMNLSTVQLLTANYGFHYTQDLIISAAECLKGYCSENRMLFQTYANRFVLYLIDYNDKNELAAFSESVGNALRSLFATDRVNGGIGILEITKDDAGVNVDSLLRRLLIASERSIAVSDEDFGITFYNEELEAIVNREADIRHAVSAVAENTEGFELFLQYQPILDLKTDSICGFEALARLRTPNLGLISPVEFIPIAEETKLIIPIGKTVIENAFHFLNKLKKHGYNAISVSVNISAIQLLSPYFTDDLLEVIVDMQVDPKKVELEITESTFSCDYDNVNRIINKLKQTGIRIAIDDFGTGYSSLAREKELNVDLLKIDKYFSDQLMDLNPDEAITGDIISMAHRLGHRVIAEGVEHEAQLRYLKEHDCDSIQGYLISKPLDEQAVFEFLERFEGNTGEIKKG